MKWKNTLKSALRTEHAKLESETKSAPKDEKEAAGRRERIMKKMRRDL